MRLVSSHFIVTVPTRDGSKPQQYKPGYTTNRGYSYPICRSEYLHYFFGFLFLFFQRSLRVQNRYAKVGFRYYRWIPLLLQAINLCPICLVSLGGGELFSASWFSPFDRAHFIFVHVRAITLQCPRAHPYRPGFLHWDDVDFGL